MYITITETMFKDAFRDAGRGDQFSYDGLTALYEFFEEIGPNMELDVIAICYEFSEYDSAVDCINDCGYGFDTSIDLFDDEEEREEEAIEWLIGETLTIRTASGIIIQDF